MPDIPDFSDFRYLNEVGWFLYREKYGYNHHTGSYTDERRVWSQMLLDEVTTLAGKDHTWICDKTVLTVGCSCTGDLAVWPAATKIAVDPLLYTYQQLGMLIEDAPGTSRTVFLSLGIEALPLLDESVDIVICRNALDHMPDPGIGMEQFWRVLKPDGVLFLSVDIGGDPTPDEPSPFTEGSLQAILNERMDVLVQRKVVKPHDEWRDYSVRVLAQKKGTPDVILDKAALLRKYEESIGADQEAVEK
ncbi:MAG: methyltransferase domain-containing protein [Acidobacteriia bacterium]|nr:methyltransferase domain-containing protein [Terriglobia bacterium]